MSEVVVVIGPGQIGQAIARRVGVAKHVLLADMRLENAQAAAEVMGNASYDVITAAGDVSSREAVEALVAKATGLGEITGLIHAAGVSPSQASPTMILGADLYNPVWTSSVKSPGDFRVALVDFVLLTVWRTPPLVVVAVSAVGGIVLAVAAP